MREQNLIDLLLETDTSELKRPEKQVKINRLSKILGTEAVITLRAIDPGLEAQISEQGMRLDAEGGVEIKELRKTHNRVILEASYVGDKQIFKDKKLREHFKCATPFDLIEKLLTSGEITKLYEEYSNLTGFTKDSVEEVKNL